MARNKFIRHYLGRPVWHLSRKIWELTPKTLQRTAPFRSFGRLIHQLSRLKDAPDMSEFTCFLRNRPLYSLICEVTEGSHFDTPVRIAVLGCSTGAEVFSLKWLLSQSIETPIAMIGSDFSRNCLEICRQARYKANDEAVKNLSRSEIEALFDVRAESLTIKKSLQSDIIWKCLDIRDTDLPASLGPQHVVIANNILIHMPDDVAEASLRNLANSVEPGGLLCITGVDLDLRVRVARTLKLQPITSRIEEIHHGYSPILDAWPCSYYGLEQYDAHHPDHDYRYSMLYRVIAQT